ncbi:ribonuclease III family protein [Candidatus Mycoplasma haematohominis]|uniref:Ribonuclease 3 n=1 Tax=Candidatus Mycoplasma haematohominis TaxID=1494318 RepID=A0A478FTA4_9MOLU|nr:ribonuclease III domain-containing protein [Candidatus Mycoplasma haemohominis]GCE63240.1 ribonuclease 3 [Candidatus Mycoplasma haemohominis]
MVDFHNSIKFFLREKFSLEAEQVDFFVIAFTHSSFKKNRSIEDYEKLELLGDSCISWAITNHLYKLNISLKDICNTRKEIVSGASLTWISKNLGLDKYARLGKGCHLSDAILEDMYESFIAAVYLTFGYETAEKIVLDTLYKNFEAGEIPSFIDYKTKLQEWAQANGNKKIIYSLEETTSEKGKATIFTVSVSWGNQVRGWGKGTKLKDAEQMAAKDSLIKSNEIGKV